MCVSLESALAIPNFVVSAVLCLTTIGYLIATALLLKHSRVSYERTVKLTSKLHADTLTPYITITDIIYILKIHSKKLPLLKFENIDQFVQESSGSFSVNIDNQLQEIDDLELLLNLTIQCNNISQNPSTTLFKVQFGDEIIEHNCIIPGKDGATLSDVEFRIPLIERSQIEDLFSQGKKLNLVMKSKGPGLSAVSIGRAEIKLKYADYSTKIKSDNPDALAISEQRDYD